MKNSLDTAKNFKGLKLIVFFILFVIAGSYALFYDLLQRYGRKYKG